MRDAPRISDVEFSASSPRQVSQGLLGWIRCRLDDCVWLDGIALRQTARGKLVLVFPGRRDNLGRDHAFVRPADEATRQSIELQIMTALRVQGVAA